jgi:adiponectin receptor
VARKTVETIPATEMASYRDGEPISKASCQCCIHDMHIMAFEELYIDSGHHELPKPAFRPGKPRSEAPQNPLTPSPPPSSVVDDTDVASPPQSPPEPPADIDSKHTSLPPKPTNRLLTWDELPHWLRDNHYIQSGYRPPSYHVLKSLRSAFAVHNETVNIQTHLLGGVSFVLFAVFCTTLSLPKFLNIARLSIPLEPLIPFLLGAIACLFCSATFHSTSNVSPRVAQIGNQLDYLGIVCLITGSFVASIRLSFHCEPFYLNFYTVLITTLGTACAVATMLPRFRTPAWRPIRAAMFVGLGLTAVFPMGHGWWMWGWAELDRRIGGVQMVLEGLLYTSGAGLYAARWPERQWPGKVDLLGTSHQIFHVLVVTAAWCHCYGVLRSIAYAERHIC